jgi:hypothetical protein
MQHIHQNTVFCEEATAAFTFKRTSSYIFFRAMHTLWWIRTLFSLVVSILTTDYTFEDTTHAISFRRRKPMFTSFLL